LVSALLAASCKKQVAAAPPATPHKRLRRAPGTDDYVARAPATIDRGQAATLQWEARNAANVQIEPGLGAVAATGNRAVNRQHRSLIAAGQPGPAVKPPTRRV